MLFFESGERRRGRRRAYDIRGILRHLSWSEKFKEGKTEREKREVDQLDIRILQVPLPTSSCGKRD